MKTSTLSFITPLVLACSLAQAQAPQKLEPIPEPPVVAPGSREDIPEVTIRNRGKDRHEEYRIRGRLYMVKVTPGIGRPYYLIDRKGDGNFVRHNETDKGLVVPQWVVLNW